MEDKNKVIRKRLYTSVLLVLMAFVAIMAATVAWFSIADKTKVKTMSLDIAADTDLRMDLDAHAKISQYVKTLSFQDIAKRMQSEKGFSMENTPLEPVTTADQNTFTYEDGEMVLEHAELTIEKGTFMAIVGPSGAGKSTLIKLLLNLAELQEGSLYIETTAGRQTISAGMRSIFAYVPQGNLILSGTIRDNITFGNSDVEEPEVVRAAELACIAEDIETFPERYDTVIGERGIGLSEGQAQRIAIARAILNEAPVLLLDECTSALDGDTEERLLRNLKQLKNRTIVCISHKDATIQSADKIVRLEDGRFVVIQ